MRDAHDIVSQPEANTRRVAFRMRSVRHCLLAAQFAVFHVIGLLHSLAICDRRRYCSLKATYYHVIFALLVTAIFDLQPATFAVFR